MKIENLLLNNIILNNKEDIFKEGSILKGKIIELLDQKVIIDVKGYGNFPAMLETDLNIVLGNEISFLVKTSRDNEFHLKPLIINENPSSNLKDNNPISKLLLNINIKETKLSIGLVENLMKYNAPITEENLIDGLKSLEKLYQLVDINEEEKVILLNSSNSDKDVVPSETKDYSNTDAKLDRRQPLSTQNEKSENLYSLEKEDIKYLLVVNKNDYPDKKDLSLIVKEYLGNEINTEVEDEYVKFISFFIKNNIKPSLNNIKNIREFNNNPIEFAEDFRQIKSLISKLEHGEITKSLLNTEVSISSKDIISSKNNKLDELQKLIQDFDTKANSQQKDELKNIENKIDFLRDLNKDLSFLFLPIHYGKEDLNGILTLLKDKRKKNTLNDKINIFINLNTNNLGSIKISCQLMANSINVKINIAKEDLDLFKSTEKQLVENVLAIGYILNNVEYVVDDYIRIIDSIVSNPNPTYILDLKV